ncbi:MAG: WD40 repeat domain-containing serine/threonine protein kinase [Phycisphaerales bacterium JB059]
METSPNLREERIAASCAGDAALEHEVRSLLQHQGILNDPEYPLSDDAIDALAADLRAASSSPSAGQHAPGTGLIGEAFAGYQIHRVLGEGGTGLVYAAEQANPRRLVALKVIDGLRGMPSAHRRLEIEAEILARLHHPGIAQVYEAGFAPTSAGGTPRPYFAMELIADGLPLTAFAEQASLDVRARLDLVAGIADAIDHAHRHGVIHRDLKPDNVLVTPEGRAKVLDFGIARIVGDSTLAATTVTREGQILGTLAYMAPEQLAGDPSQIGVASDVYALGVILFELLAGRLPLDLGGLSISAAVRLIEFETPPTLGALDRALRGDIETIVETCLRREPERRYGSAAALAADIRRHLAKKTILARKPSWTYRSSKFVQRNKVVVAATLVVATTIITGIIIASAFALESQRARLTAENERTNAQLREVDSIRGVLTSASLLNERDQPWEAVRQLHSIPPPRRNWEWRHQALSLPWVIEHGRERTADDSLQPEQYAHFVDDTRLIAYVPDTPQAWLHDTATNTRTTIPIGNLEISRVTDWKNAPPGRVAVNLTDARTGELDTSTGRFTPWAFSLDSLGDHDLYPRFYPAPDPRTVVAWVGTLLQIFVDGDEVFRLDSGTDDPPGMNWHRPEFSTDGRWIYLASWGAGGEIITVDTRTWTVHARAASSAYGPWLVLSRDGDRLYSHTVEAGIEVFSTPDLRPLDPIDADDGWTWGVALAPASERIAAFFVDKGVLRVYDALDHRQLFERSMGGVNQNAFLDFSHDGRLIAALTPQLRMSWIVDTTRPAAPTATPLEGHRSWIYQLAVSPDGSLLASAAPEGDVLLWDLCASRLLARVPRVSGDRIHNMNAPLVFTPSGDTLVFAERAPGPGSNGYTRLNLDTGARDWTQTPSFAATLDAIASQLGGTGPAPMSPYSAVLADGRILRGDAASMAINRVIVRPPDAEADEIVELNRDRARLWTGVAPHPDGSVYASGEYLMLRIRDARTDEVLHEISDGVMLPGYSIAYSPDGSRLAMATEAGSVIIFETEFYKKIAEIYLEASEQDSDRNYVFALAWTPDGDRLVTAADTRIRVLESERPLLRDQERAAWEHAVSQARQALAGEAHESPVPPPALRVARIEQWADPGPGSEDLLSE